MNKIDYDRTEQIGKSIINHGKYNDRIYLMKLDKEDLPNIINILDNLANENKYTKIFVKTPHYLNREFVQNGYILEATIPNFYNEEAELFMGKYFSENRLNIKNEDKIKEIIMLASSKDKISEPIELGEGYTFSICDESDSKQMSELYTEVFETYPFPIKDEEYLKKTMNENFYYFAIKYKGNLISLASTEMDYSTKSVEMTDFATHPDFRGNGFSLFLLNKMEESMRKENFKVAYTIARSLSYGMNITFSKLGYNFCGTLINNTNIYGNLESMNVWSKQLLNNS
ncbi:putative beta-lysine N-acetyltransferase [Clostridium sp. DL1XJH146]